MWDEDYSVMRATITQISAVSAEITIANHTGAVGKGVNAYVTDRNNDDLSSLEIVDQKIVSLLAYRALLRNPSLIK